jgi:NAD/NADP transhydrogenase beta subunit
MNDESQLTEQQSLDLIIKMINKAKYDYRGAGIAALMWGTVITFCSLVSYINYYEKWQWAQYVWFLTFIAVIPQIIISVRQSRKKKYKSYSEDAMGGIWISFGISIFLLSFFSGLYDVPSVHSLFLILYGIPTFATGFARKFTPMIIGGITCWAFAIISMYIEFPYAMLLTAAAALIAWFIPGIILRKRYLKAKESNV